MTKGENIAILGAAFQGVNERTDHHIFRIDNQKTKLVKTRRIRIEIDIHKNRKIETLGPTELTVCRRQLIKAKPANMDTNAESAPMTEAAPTSACFGRTEQNFPGSPAFRSTSFRPIRIQSRFLA